MQRLSPQRLHRLVRSVIVAGMAVALVWTCALPVQQAHAQSTKTPWQHLTPSQLTAVWWQWLLSIQQSQSPVFDSTGANALSSQPYYSGQGNGDLFFLAGTFVVTQLAGGNVLGEVTRTITVKQGTTFFFPLLNSEGDNVCGTPHLGGNCFGTAPFPVVSGVPALRAFIAPPLNSAIGLSATLTPTDETFNHATGTIQDLDHPRLQSPPFSYTLPATDNLYQSSGINVSGTVAPAVSDGYWSFAETLQAGYYRLEFGGSIPNFDNKGHTFTEAITYDIIVLP